MSSLLIRKHDIFSFEGSKQFIDSYVQRQNAARKPKFSFAAKQKPKVSKNEKRKVCDKRKVNTSRSQKKRPNRMSSDKLFLRKLAKQINGMDIEGPWGVLVSRKAIEGINFLQRRDIFWNQIDTL